MTVVSVLIPVHNGERFLAKALRSIVHQTYSNFEVVVINDASTDDTAEILTSLKDSRLRILSNVSNVGVACSLNRGLDAVQSEYIVRMDADDEAHPDRIRQQVDYMEANPQVGISGTWAKHIGKYHGVVERRPSGPETIRAFMMLDNPILHPTVIMRRSLIEKHGLRYDPFYERCEDFELWERASHYFKFENLAEPLLRFRVHEDSVTAINTEEMWQRTLEVLHRGLIRLGIDADEKTIRFHRRIAHGEEATSIPELWFAEKWLHDLVTANQVSGAYPQEALVRAISFCWFRLCRNSSRLGMAVWPVYNRSTFAGSLRTTLRGRLTLLSALFWHSFCHPPGKYS